MPFEKGHPGGPGRPIGSRTRKWNNLQDWFEMMLEGWEGLSDQKKFDGAIQGMTVLLNKVQSIHLTQEESKSNVDNSILFKKQELINNLESKSLESTAVTSTTESTAVVNNSNGIKQI